MNRPRSSRRSRTSFGLLLALTACSGSAPPPPAAPGAPAPSTTPVATLPVPSSAPPPHQGPPPPGVAPDWKFPAIEETSLDNGLAVRLVQRRSLPLVRIDLVVQSGSATDGSRPGLAAVAGELLKAGGAGKWGAEALVAAAESLGGSLDVVTDRDSTRIGIGVTRDHLSAALDLVAAVVVKPRLDGQEFRKLKRREMDRVDSLSRTNAGWVSSMVLQRELFRLPTGVHPYSRYDATSKELDALRLEDCRAWHLREVTPKNAFLVIAGDVDPKTASDEAHRAFAAWTGERPEPTVFTTPVPPGNLSLFLVDRPGSPQAEVYVGTLGPERKGADWPAVRAANQILGGGVAGRLFLDVREKRSLAYRTRSQVDGLAHGPSTIVLSAGTQTAKAGLALQALLEHFDAVGRAAPTEDELAIASRFLSDVFLVGADTVTSLASMTSDLGVLGLPPDYYDTYRKAVREVTEPAVLDAARRYFQPGKAVVVVAGDATRLSRPLSHFGAVRIVDAAAGFATRTVVPHDPTAVVDLPRIEGT